MSEMTGISKGAMNRKEYLSLIRVISCAAVVVLHTFHTAIAMKLLPEESLACAGMIRALMYFAVPCFVMVTGALLLSPERELTYGKLFGKYILKVLAAIVIFTAAFSLADCFFSGNTDFARSLAGVPGKIWTDGSWSHMWYLYTLTGLYILMPAMRKITALSDRRDLLYLLAVGMIFLSVLPFIHTLTGTESGFRIAVTSVYPLFLFAGYAVDREYLKIGRGGSAALLAAGACGIGAMAFFQGRDESGTLKSLLSDYTLPLIVLMSAGVFGLVKNCCGEMAPAAKRVTGAVDRCGFGIYLIHLFWLRLLVTKLAGFGITPIPVPGFLLLAFAVFVLSLGTTEILIRLPGIRKVL